MSPTSSWTSGAGFWSDGDPDDIPNGVQLLALETDGENFYGVGSTISAPNTVFLPKWEPGTASLDFQILQFNQSGLGAFTGALWDIDVSADWIVVGGVNQSAGTGMIYTNRRTAELTDPATWHEFDVADVLPERSTWITGVCLGADVIYAVGRESRAGWGFVLRSTDGGASFVDISPPEAERLPDVSRCMVRDGELLIAGAQGLFARYHTL